MTERGLIERVQRGLDACICLPVWILKEDITQTDFSKKVVWTSEYTGDALIAEVPIFF